MEKYNDDILQHLKWEQNEAPHITALMEKKALWRKDYHDAFWENWLKHVFDIDNAQQFGLALWCIILGVSSDLFDFNQATQRWAFGRSRQNFIYDDQYHNPSLPANKQSKGGNYGNEQASLTNIDDIRTLLKFRYATLVSNGRIQYMNMMMNWILNKGIPWDIANKKYAYAIDNTSVKADIQAKVYIYDWQGMREIETGAASNRQLYLLHSEDLADSSFTPSGATITANRIKSPNGLSSADVLFADSSTGVHNIVFPTSGSYSANDKYLTYSVFLKSEGYDRVGITITHKGSGQQDSQISYNTVNIAARIVGGGGESRVIAYPSGWIRVFLSVPILPGYDASEIKIGLLNDNSDSSFEGDIHRGVAIWGWLLEEGHNAYRDYVSATDAASTTIGANLVSSAGSISFGRVPVSGMQIYWSGLWGIGSQGTPLLVATANGTNNAFQIPKPLNDGALITESNYIEFRIGKNVNMSYTLINLMNDRSNGLMFQNAGVKYLIVKES